MAPSNWTSRLSAKPHFSTDSKDSNYAIVAVMALLGENGSQIGHLRCSTATLKCNQLKFELDPINSGRINLSSPRIGSNRTTLDPSHVTLKPPNPCKSTPDMVTWCSTNGRPLRLRTNLNWHLGRLGRF